MMYRSLLLLQLEARDFCSNTLITVISSPYIYKLKTLYTMLLVKKQILFNILATYQLCYLEQITYPFVLQFPHLS